MWRNSKSVTKLNHERRKKMRREGSTHNMYTFVPTNGYTRNFKILLKINFNQKVVLDIYNTNYCLLIVNSTCASKMNK